MKRPAKIICTALVLVLLLVGCVVMGWFDTWFGNQVDYVTQKIDDATSYDTRKMVEDSCRAMISSYEADKLTYEQYDGSENKEQQSWADQAKMRANRTAANYNNYVLKNSYVWRGNVPPDINTELPFVE